MDGSHISRRALAAAEAMRRILVENARRKRRLKRGGHLHRSPLENIEVECGVPSNDLLALDEALSKLETEDREKAEVVRLRFFVGLNHEEAGKVLGVSAVTARRHWRFARAWLRREMRKVEEPDQATDL